MTPAFAKFFGSRRFLVSGFVIVLAGLLVLGFGLKRPLLIVADDECLAIYGRNRAVVETWVLRFRLFRPIANVIVDPNADEASIVGAIAAAASRPIAVLFPRRYEAAAAAYGERFIGVPVVVLNDDETEYRDRPNFIFVTADRATDYYRAGRALSLFVVESATDSVQPGAGSAAESTGAEPTKAVAFFRDGRDDRFDADFTAGMVDGGYSGPIVFTGAAAAQRPWLGVVFAAASGPILASIGYDLPFVLFSWVDPGLLPDAAIMVFDDSPWALAETAYYAARAGISVVKPSKMHAGPAFAKLGIKDPARIWRRSADNELAATEAIDNSL